MTLPRRLPAIRLVIRFVRADRSGCRADTSFKQRVGARKRAWFYMWLCHFSSFSQTRCWNDSSARRLRTVNERI